MVAREIEAALSAVDRLLQKRAPYEAVVAALDACAAMPGAHEYMPGIGQRRLAAVNLYGRSDAECDREISEFLRMEQPLHWRSQTLVSACADRPALAARYLPETIASLEAHIDDEGVRPVLALAYMVCSRLGVDAHRAPAAAGELRELPTELPELPTPELPTPELPTKGHG